MLGVLLALGGCTDGERSEGSVQPATPASPAASTADLYAAADLDLCAKTDRAPLADLKLTVRGTDPKPPPSAPGSACLFEMRTADGHEASLRVEAATPSSADQARQLYQATADVSGMSRDAAVTGLGEQAEGFAKQSDPGFKYAEYLIHAQTGNLVVKVWLAVGGDSYVPKRTLAAAVREIAGATLQLVPKA